MSSFCREDFAVRSKSELLDYIEQQSDQISRLETRFRDVVRAYRGTIKEKEALEATLNALSRDGRCEGEREMVGGVESEEGEGEGEGVSEVRETEEEESDADTSMATERKGTGDSTTVASLRQQLATLTSSLQTLTVERAKNEASFLKDKKIMLGQQEVMVRQHQTTRKELEHEFERVQSALLVSQANLRAERLNREEEQGTHADMLRELQGLIASERDGRETLGLQLQEMEREILTLRSQLSDVKSGRDREMDEVVQSLSLQVSNLEAQLQLEQKRSSQPPPQLVHLQREMERTKEEHVKSLLLEQQRSSEFEERLKQQSMREEQQVAGLETKVSQLSETVGSYVLLREQDQTTTQKLKERIALLDVENTQLTREHVERREETTQTAGQVTGLHEKIAKLKTFLKMATAKITEKTALPTNLEEMSLGEYRDLIGRETLGKHYQLELVQLREEFERYKTRAQTVLRNKDTTAAPPDHGKNTESMKSRLLDLQEQVETLRREREEEEEKHLVATRRLREEIREVADRNRSEVVAMETQHKEKLQELQRHVRTTRERTMKLISEKDAEMTHLRAELQSLRSHSHSGGLERSLSHVSNSSSNHQDGMRNGGMEFDPAPSLFQTDPSMKRSMNLSTKSTESVSAVQEILEQPSPGPTKEPQLLHFIHEQRRRESELANVRRRRFELEDSVRELQGREQHHLEQCVFLKDQIRKLERDRSRETESMEYLKNIVFHFMCSDSYGREQMVPPIATILHFSPDEVRTIKEKAAARRWIPRHSQN